MMVNHVYFINVKFYKYYETIVKEYKLVISVNGQWWILGRSDSI